jgi:hypothetical protein
VKFTANNIRVSFDESQQQEVTFTLTQKQPIDDLKAIIANKKLLAIECKEYRKKRSLDANGMLWAICTQIAAAIKSSKDEVYLTMLERYGVFTHIIVKAEAVERIKQEWRTCRVLGEVTVNGKTGIQIQCYYGSHLYDSKEFSVLLEGVISEAQEMGIEVVSEQDKQLLIQQWGK